MEKGYFRNGVSLFAESIQKTKYYAIGFLDIFATNFNKGKITTQKVINPAIPLIKSTKKLFCSYHFVSKQSYTQSVGKWYCCVYLDNAFFAAAGTYVFSPMGKDLPFFAAETKCGGILASIWLWLGSSNM